MKFFYLLALFITTLIYPVDICFLTTEATSAKEFIELTRVLEEKKISWKILAADDAEIFLKKEGVCYTKLSLWTSKGQLGHLKDHEIEAIAKVTAKNCKKAKVVITEVSLPLMRAFHKELSMISQAQRWLYYDSSQIKQCPEYSRNLDRLMQLEPKGIIFSQKDFISKFIDKKNDPADPQATS
jgi:hypothetical protein